MADRTPVFEMHILPMFRLLDRRHMLRVDKHLDLWDYDSVKAKANAIVTRAVGDRPSMPTPGTGGAWPVEWRAVFKRWVAGGVRRLSLGAGNNYKLSAADDGFLLTCTVAVPDAPDGDSAAWFDIVDPGPSAATYRLYVFAGEAVPPATATIDMDVREVVDAASAANGISVIDASGTHRVTITTV